MKKLKILIMALIIMNTSSLLADSDCFDLALDNHCYKKNEPGTASSIGLCPQHGYMRMAQNWNCRMTGTLLNCFINNDPTSTCNITCQGVSAQWKQDLAQGRYWCGGPPPGK